MIDFHVWGKTKSFIPNIYFDLFLLDGMAEFQYQIKSWAALYFFL